MNLLIIGILAVVAVVVGLCIWALFPLKTIEFYDDDWDAVDTRTGGPTQVTMVGSTIVRKTRSDKGQKRAPYTKRSK